MLTFPSPRRGLAQLAIAIAAALCVAPAAHAGVLNFDTPGSTATVMANDTLRFGSYYVYGNSAAQAGVVGAVRGSAACSAPLQCPTNDASAYYSALQGGYMWFGMDDGSAFSLGSVDASFIGSGKASYPATSGLLMFSAYNGNAFVGRAIVNLFGPAVGDGFTFARYDLSSLGGGQLFTDVLVSSMVCDGAGNCDANSKLAQFAIDNIVTVNASDVPEPASVALLGLGLFGLAAARRRAA